MEDEYYTIPEVAKKFRVTNAAVYKWMNSGKLDYVIIGSHRRITSSALKKFVQSGEDQRGPITGESETGHNDTTGDIRTPSLVAV